MLKTTFLHFSFKDDVGFLLLKQSYIGNKLWKFCFYTHVFTAVICLLAGLIQFSNDILSSFPKTHRLIGKVYVINILVINFPVGMVMAFYANGFWPTKTAFVILDLLWFYFTLIAYLEIKKGSIQRHKEYMIRSFALTFSAITLRSWNMLLSNVSDLEPLMLYMINGWLGFIPNMIIAELIIRLQNISSANR